MESYLHLSLNSTIAVILIKDIFLLISSIMQINIQKKNLLSNNIFYLHFFKTVDDSNFF